MLKESFWKFILLQLICLNFVISLPISAMATRSCLDVLKKSQGGTSILQQIFGKASEDTEHFIALANYISKFNVKSIPFELKKLQLDLFADHLMEIKEALEKPTAVADENIRQVVGLLEHQELTRYLVNSFVLHSNLRETIQRSIHSLLSISFFYFGEYPRESYFYQYLVQTNHDLKTELGRATPVSHLLHPMVFTNGLFIERAQVFSKSVLSDDGGRLQQLNEMVYKRRLSAAIALSVLNKVVLRTNPLPLTRFEKEAILNTMVDDPSRWSNPLELLGFEMVDYLELPEMKLGDLVYSNARGELLLNGKPIIRVIVKTSHVFLKQGQVPTAEQNKIIGLDKLKAAILDGKENMTIEIESYVAVSRQ